MEGRMRKELQMLAINTRVSALNVRKMETVKKTETQRLIIGMVFRLRLGKLTKG